MEIVLFHWARLASSMTKELLNQMTNRGDLTYPKIQAAFDVIKYK